MKWIVGTWFENPRGIYEVVERSWDGHVVVEDRLGKTYHLHESKLEQSFSEGKIYNHRVSCQGLDIHLDLDGVVKKIKKYRG